MAITAINVGTAANDGTGDTLREAFIKVNNNDNDLDSRVNAMFVGFNQVQVLTESEYAGITPDSNTLYVLKPDA